MSRPPYIYDEGLVLTAAKRVAAGQIPHRPMPVRSAIKDNALFAPLSYYQLSVPVVPCHGALNAEAIQARSSFLREAAQRHERFLALAFEPSYETLDWLASNAEGTSMNSGFSIESRFWNSCPASSRLSRVDNRPEVLPMPAPSLPPGANRPAVDRRSARYISEHVPSLRIPTT
jgi:hypothetical protein